MKKVLLLCDEIPKHHGVQLTHALHLFFHIFSTIANKDIQSIVRQKIYLQAILCHLIEGQIYKIQYVLRVKTISSFLILRLNIHFSRPFQRWENIECVIITCDCNC